MDKEQGTKVKVIMVEEYLVKARENDPDTKTAWNDALVLMYAENTIVSQIVRKGETKFIAEA